MSEFEKILNKQISRIKNNLVKYRTEMQLINTLKLNSDKAKLELERYEELIELSIMFFKSCNNVLELINTNPDNLSVDNKREILDVHCVITSCDNCKIKEKTGYIGFNCHICDEHIDDAVSLILENKE